MNHKNRTSVAKIIAEKSQMEADIRTFVAVIKKLCDALEIDFKTFDGADIGTTMARIGPKVVMKFGSGSTDLKVAMHSMQGLAPMLDRYKYLIEEV